MAYSIGVCGGGTCGISKKSSRASNRFVKDSYDHSRGLLGINEHYSHLEATSNLHIKCHPWSISCLDLTVSDNCGNQVFLVRSHKLIKQS